jgi:hypothetical protein
MPPLIVVIELTIWHHKVIFSTIVAIIALSLPVIYCKRKNIFYTHSEEEYEELEDEVFEPKRYKFGLPVGKFAAKAERSAERPVHSRTRAARAFDVTRPCGVSCSWLGGRRFNRAGNLMCVGGRMPHGLHRVSAALLELWRA